MTSEANIIPKLGFNGMMRGQYQAGRRRRHNKGDNWNCKCVNCGASFENRMLLRKHFVQCDQFEDVQILKQDEDKSITAIIQNAEIEFDKTEKENIDSVIDTETQSQFRKSPDLANEVDHKEPNRNELTGTYRNEPPSKADNADNGNVGDVTNHENDSELGKDKSLEESSMSSASVMSSAVSNVLQSVQRKTESLLENADQTYSADITEKHIAVQNQVVKHKRKLDEENCQTKTKRQRISKKITHQMQSTHPSNDVIDLTSDKLKTATQSQNKKVNIVSKDLVYGCQLCPLKFRWQSRLWRHVRKEHKEYVRLMNVQDFNADRINNDNVTNIINFQNQKQDLGTGKQSKCNKTDSKVEFMNPTPTVIGHQNCLPTQQEHIKAIFNAESVLKHLRQNLTCLQNSPIKNTEPNASSQVSGNYALPKVVQAVRENREYQLMTPQCATGPNSPASDVPLDLSMNKAPSNKDRNLTSKYDIRRQKHTDGALPECEKAILKSQFLPKTDRDFLQMYYMGM